MVSALIGISGSAQVAPPPNRPTMTSLPPLLRQSKPSCVVLALPTRSITARIGPPAPPTDGRERAGLLGGFALAGVDIDHDGALAAHRLQKRQRHQAKAAGADDDDRRLEVRLDLLQRAVGGDNGAG